MLRCVFFSLEKQDGSWKVCHVGSFLNLRFYVNVYRYWPFRTSSRCPFDKVCSFNQKIRLKDQIGTKHFGHGKYTLFTTFVCSSWHSPFKRAIKVGGKCQIDGGNLIITLCLLLSGDVHQSPISSDESIGAAACYNREGQKGQSNDPLFRVYTINRP